MATAKAKQSLRETAKGGTDPLPKLSDYDGEMLVFDCTPSSVTSGEGAGEDGKAHYRPFPDVGYGASTNLVLPVLIVSPDGGGKYDVKPDTAIFQEVIGQTLETHLDAFAKGEDADGNAVTSPYVVGRIGKKGRTWILTPPEDDAEWDAIEAAVTAYEAAF